MKWTQEFGHPVLHRILCQTKSSFKMREVMDQRRILIVNLAKGKIGEDAAQLLGALLVSRIELAALSRANVPETARKDCYAYLDEFSSYASENIGYMLSELRKYRLSLVLAHQFLSQLDPKVLDAILGNVGTLIAFRVGVQDAEILEKELWPAFTARDLVNLPHYNIYIKLIVDGTVTKPFSAETVQDLGEGA